MRGKIRLERVRMGLLKLKAQESPWCRGSSLTILMSTRGTTHGLDCSMKSIPFLSTSGSSCLCHGLARFEWMIFLKNEYLNKTVLSINNRSGNSMTKHHDHIWVGIAPWTGNRLPLCRRTRSD